MTQEQKAKAYDGAIKIIKDNLDALNEITETGAKVVNIQSIKNCFYKVFPELRESDDERIRKSLIAFFQRFPYTNLYDNSLTAKNVIAWLEKQGEKQQKASIWKHWKGGICGNGEGIPIFLIKRGHTYSLSSCLSFECDYIELSELDKLLSEKQDEQKPAWSEADEIALIDALWCCKQAASIAKDENDMGNAWYAEHWLKSLKDRLK